MLRRRLQQLSAVVTVCTFTVLLCLVSSHALIRRYLPNISHGKENFDFFFEGDQEGDDRQHPPFVVDWPVVLGTVLAFLISCAVDVGGLAGGALLVPVFYQVVGFGLKASTGLSQAAIAGASAAALAANLFRAQITLTQQQHVLGLQPVQELHHHHHQHNNNRQQQQQQQPLVDLDLVLLLTPGLLLGVAVGAVMNDLLPEWFISAALVGVLWLSCHKTAVRGLLTWHAEEAAEASLAAAAAISSAPLPPLPRILTGGTFAAGRAASSCSSSPAASIRACTSSSGGGSGPDQQQQPQQQGDADDAAAGAQQAQLTPFGSSNAQSAAPQESAAAACGSDSDSSSSSSLSCRQLQRQQQRSPPVYECETTPLSGAARQHTHGQAAAADAADAASSSSGPPQTAAWYACSRSSSVATGLGYVITDDKLPALSWQHQHHQGQQQQLEAGSDTGGHELQLLSSHRAAAAAAAAALHLQQLWLWLPSVHLQRVPWMKLLSLWALWLGFMGLSALSSLLPFCSWAYVTYTLLFMGVTGCVTATLIQVLLVAPLLGAERVSSLSRKLQQLVEKHQHFVGLLLPLPPLHQSEQQETADLEQQQQQPLLQHDHHDNHCSQQQQRQHLRDDHNSQPQQQQQQRHRAADPSPAAAVPAGSVLQRAGRPTRAWLHVLTGFGRATPGGAAAAVPAPQQQHSVAASGGDAGAQQSGDVQQGEGAQQQQEQPLSLFAQMRLRQQQQQGASLGDVLPPMGPVEAATDSYFFPNITGTSGSNDSNMLSVWRQQQQAPRVQRVHPLPGSQAAAGAGDAGGQGSSSSAMQGMGRVWARVSGAVQGLLDPQQPQPQPLDPFDGNEQPWREEQPFPVAPPPTGSPGPAPSLAAAAAAAAAGSTGSSGSSNALVTIAAAAAIVSVAAGVLTALTGVAASALLMPVLLDFRVHTQVAMASTVVLVFLSSSAATLSFILQGRLIGPFAVLFALVGLCGGCVGVSIVGALLRLARRPSVVVLVLAAALAVAGVSCSITGVRGFLVAWDTGEKLGFRALCQQ